MATATWSDAGRDTLELHPHALTAADVVAAAERPVYGVSTGFGALATRHIPPGQRAHLAA